MAFLNPYILFALVAAGIPVAIHLLGRRKPRRVPFSAMVFLEQVRSQQFRRLRLRNLLLMALRTLAIAFLVLAFARPALRAAFHSLGGTAAGTMVVVLDDGPSMGYDGPTGSRFDWARSQLAEIAAAAGPNDHAVLIRTSRPDLVLPLEQPSLDNLNEPAAWSGDGTSALIHAADILRSTAASNSELYIVSDLSGPPWSTLKPVDWPEGVVPFILRPPHEETVNLAIDTVSGGGELVRIGQPLTINATLSNTGSRNVEDAQAALWIEGRRVQQKSVSIPASGRLALTFATSVARSGWVDGRVTIGDDGLRSDNSRWFSLYVPQETHVLIIGHDTQSRRSIEAIFRSPGLATPYQTVSVAPGDVTLDAVARADVLIVNEDTGISDQAVGWLRDAIRNGTGMLIILGPHTDLSFTDRRLLPMIGTTRLLGVTGIGAEDSLSYFNVNRATDANPLTRDLISAAPAGNPRFTAYVAASAPASDVRLRFNTGAPWLIRSRGNAGNGAVLTAGLNPQWSDLAYRGVVVPLMHRLVNDLARSVSFAPEYLAGQSGWFESAPSETNGQIEIESPDGLRRRALPSSDGASNGIALGTLTQTGMWRLMRNGETTALLPVNVAPAESDLKGLTPNQFTAAAGLPEAIEPAGDIAADIKAARTGTELDIVFLLLALACLAVEVRVMRGIGAGEHSPASVVSA